MEAYLGAAQRTPYGAFGGALRKANLPGLLEELIPALLGRVPPESVDRLILATPLPLEEEWVPPLAGMPHLTPLRIQQGHCSGLWGLAWALEALAAGQATRIVVLVASHPSSAPFLLPGARWGSRIGEVELRDPLVSHAPCTKDLPPPAGPGLCRLQGTGWGLGLEEDEALPPGIAWRDGAAALLLGSEPFSPAPQVCLSIQRSPSSLPPPESGDFPGGLGMAELVAAFHQEGAFQESRLTFRALRETWTIRLRREAP